MVLDSITPKVVIRLFILILPCTILVLNARTLEVMVQTSVWPAEESAVPSDEATDVPLEGPTKRSHIPLLELVKSNYTAENCPNGTIYMEDIILPVANTTKRKIPRIIHATGKTRCLTPTMAELMNRWRFDNYSIVFHDDVAVARLFHERQWSELPHLERVLPCIHSMTAKADLWRYLVLWEYGGIYHDMDTVPGTFTGESITDDHDGWFVVETLKVLSQFFMAVSPRHPLMYYAAMYGVINYIHQEDTGAVRIPSTTGPKALHMGLEMFTKHSEKKVIPFVMGGEPAVTEGEYSGDYGHSISVYGDGKRGSERIMRREAMGRPAKKEEYHKMGMKHFFEDRQRLGKSCLAVMIEKEVMEGLDPNFTIPFQ